MSQINDLSDNITKAAIYCILANFFFAIMGAGAKFLSETHHVAEIAFYRNIIVLIPFFLYIILSKNTHILKTDKPKLVALRAIIGGISLITTFGALSMLPIAYATVIFFTSAIFTPVFAFFFLKEHVGIHRWSAVIVGLIGIIVIAQPSGAFSMLGLALGLLAAIFHASMFIVLRSLKRESSLTITFYFILAGATIPGLFMPWIWSPITPDQLWIFLMVGITGGAGQFFISSAYKFAPASVVTPFGYTSLLWTIMIDILIWKYDLDFTSIFIGTALILSAQLYIMHREYKRRGL